MYRIRLHGRGGQGMKTASRILGTALFLEGYEVQDAPRYGAERRGAPIFAYVRAAREAIHERGVIRRPDLVVVADETLVPVPAAGVVSGVRAHTVLLINSGEEPAAWKTRLGFEGTVLTLPVEAEERAELPFIGAACAGAAARLLGILPRPTLERAIRDELGTMGSEVVSRNMEEALAPFDRMGEHAGCVRESEEESADTYERPGWVDLPLDEARISAPDVHAAATSVQVRTGLWRTMRPIIEYEHCNRCSWICSTYCPDSAIHVEEDRTPRIDYDHCKGCMICVAVCPPHAIRAVPEREALADESKGGAA
jgi:pyruvate ferredoxin oxidoreductase gamma subunit